MAVQVSVADGASVTRGQAIADRPGRPVSRTATPLSVTFPVFVTAKLYRSLVPAAAKLDGDTDFTSVSDAPRRPGTVAVDAGENNGAADPGGVPCAVAEFVTDPASASACVTT